MAEEKSFRRFAAAGVHVENDRDDTFHANRSFVTVHAGGDGPRRLRLPRPSDVFDVIQGRTLATAPPS